MKKVTFALMFLMIMSVVAAQSYHVNLAPYVKEGMESASTLDELLWAVNQYRLHPVRLAEYKEALEASLESYAAGEEAGEMEGAEEASKEVAMEMAVNEDAVVLYLLSVLEDPRDRVAWEADDWNEVIDWLYTKMTTSRNKPLLHEATQDLMLQALFKEEATSIYAKKEALYNPK